MAIVGKESCALCDPTAIAEVTRHSGAVAAEARAILVDAVVAAARRLVEIALQGDDRAALPAISAILDRVGVGKNPTLEADQPGVELLSPIEEIRRRLADMRRRIEAAEELDGSGKPG